MRKWSNPAGVGTPDALKGACPVWGGLDGNLLLKGNKAPSFYSITLRKLIRLLARPPPLRAKTGSPSVSRSMACPPTWCTRRSRLWPTCQLCDCANARRSTRGKSRHRRRERVHRRPRRRPGGLPRGVSHRRTISLSTSRQKTSRPPTN